MYTVVNEQNPISWIPVAVAAIAAISAVVAQLVTRLGEPRRLRMLKSLNEAIAGYKTTDAGRAELVAARKALARRAASALLARPLGLTLLNGAANTLLALFYVALAFAVYLIVTNAEEATINGVFAVGGVMYLVWIVLAIIHHYADRNWQRGEIAQATK